MGEVVYKEKTFLNTSTTTLDNKKYTFAHLDYQ